MSHVAEVNIDGVVLRRDPYGGIEIGFPPASPVTRALLKEREDAGLPPPDDGRAFTTIVNERDIRRLAIAIDFLACDDAARKAGS